MLKAILLVKLTFFHFLAFLTLRHSPGSQVGYFSKFLFAKSVLVFVLRKVKIFQGRSVGRFFEI